MKIRNAVESDIPRMLEIYEYARQFMVEHGNPHQWNERKWPPEELLRKDIEKGHSFVCEESGRVVGTFCYFFGKDIDPTYLLIENGQWLSDSAYGVVHRIASDGTIKGTGSFCINWAFEQCRHLRMDTHGDNYVMQNLLSKLGFSKCGIIHIVEDNYPRIAFEKI